MTFVQHPATEILSAILPSDPCRIICEFAAPHAAPTITTVYRLIRTEQKEELDIFAARWAEGGYGVQYIVEFSPDGRDLVCRQIRVSSNWTRERERYGLGRKNFCLCEKLTDAMVSCEPKRARTGVRCRYTSGALALRHLRSPPLPAYPPQHYCELNGDQIRLDGELFGIRRYQKWICSVHDERRTLVKACATNGLGHHMETDPHSTRDSMVQLLMML